MNTPYDGNDNMAEGEDYEKRIKELDAIIENFIGRAELHSSDPKVKEEFLKKRNAYYSQRKYYRKKLKIETLEKQRDKFLKKNANVSKQNELLEQLLTCAKNQVQIQEMLESKNPKPTGTTRDAGPSALSSLRGAPPRVINSSIAPPPDLSREAQLRRLLLGSSLAQPRAGEVNRDMVASESCMARALRSPDLGTTVPSLQSQYLRTALLQKIKRRQELEAVLRRRENDVTGLGMLPGRSSDDLSMQLAARLQVLRDQEALVARLQIPQAVNSANSNGSFIYNTLDFAEGAFGLRG